MDEEGGRCGLVCVPVEAFEAGGLKVTPISFLIEAEGEVTFICCNPATLGEVAEPALAGECPFICCSRLGFSGVIVTPPPGGFGTIGTPPLPPVAIPPPPTTAPLEGFGAMGMGDRRTDAAVPPGEKSCRRADDPGDVSLSCSEERGDSRPRKPRDLSLGWIRGGVPDVLIPPRGVGRATSL